MTWPICLSLFFDYVQYAVLKIKTICHTRDLWNLAWFCKQLHSLCLPDPRNLLEDFKARREFKISWVRQYLVNVVFFFNKEQGSTLTVFRLVIPSSFCCRTTWTSVYGCPLVKLRKLIKWIILDRTFIKDWVDRMLPSESINTFDLQCTRSYKLYLFHLCSKENNEWLTGYTKPFHGWLVTHGQPWRCSPGRLYDVMSALTMLRGWPAAQRTTLCGWCASGRW